VPSSEIPLAITPDAAHPTIAMAAAGMPRLWSLEVKLNKKSIREYGSIWCSAHDQNAISAGKRLRKCCRSYIYIQNYHF